MDFDQSYYERQYRNYERQNPRRKLIFYKRLAELAAGRCERPRILDIGCAFGLFLSQLDSRWERFGVDASTYAIGRARELSAGSGIRFDVAQTGQFPFSGPFDVITAFDVLEHVEDLDSVMSWICRNIKPSGGFVFVVPVYDGPTGPIIRLLDKDPTHVHRQSRTFWVERASRDFRLLDWWGIYRYLLPSDLYLHAVTRRLRQFTPAIGCLAQVRER